ncbi:sensor histidine kinase [Bifidobacterium longum]|uniref:sensor histidine kinase n=1 Tax=Bifidobacterium longum TaxID=216816 RepID=UPI001F2DD9AC|nr:HAMP domain-containing sensor histidine kinase [Bifidobacterium longum]
MKATNTAKASGRIQALAGKLRPKSFRAKLTLAISLVFLIAMGSATLVQTIVVNSMFTYATTVTAKNPEMQVESQHSGSGTGKRPDSDPRMFSRGSGTGLNDITGTSSVGGDMGDGDYQVEWGKDGSYTINTPYGVSVWNQDNIATGLRISAAIIFVFFGITSILIIWLVTSRMSRQLTSISAQTAALDPAKLDTRIDVNGPPSRRRPQFRRAGRRGTEDWDHSTDSRTDGRAAGQSSEVTQLGDAINGMLDRIQSASEAERRFVSNASHELRTPIAAVETNLDAPLAQGRFPEDVRPSVQRALDANRRGAQLVQALLTLSRIQSGTIGGKQAGDVTQMSPASTARTSTDLYGCVGNSLADIDDAATKRRITITVNKAGGDADMFLIAADPALLELAVGNLLRNAVVHNTDDGSIDVTVVSDEDGSGPRLTVTNTTDEMLPDDLNELTQPFHRGENSRISAVPGVGLGLSIASAACEAMGAGLELGQPAEGEFRASIRF